MHTYLLHKYIQLRLTLEAQRGRLQRGASGPEYAALLAIVAIVAAGVAILGPKITDAFNVNLK